ncbi:competence protein ComEA helix-hairpin-helix repeat protein [Arcobacter nitrofigilis DSM 7299]|uniref:Competence protein ComEA helix-hairpin-helix repeat protein n=1 Tax=Arcobacter nitrofigilis (strain ATCC 33309 / DSM 7299 / CCUG 15893 / LMG 7604 / NCTC 12251 / CI) TaxID=572480 RepID=D5UZW7_ARCNC|nr:ComEA family DNA-binding protein [Arcobacter nitrofigilis]ADG93336.1 competence protein ComEA helix-hairpin-helix repeat protein [Arcobacter nitrofigilis DSM 7299]
MKIILMLTLFCLALFAIDINKASVEELKTLNGIGAKKAESIVQYRTQHKCFKNKDDLLNVKGIGKALLEKNEDKISFSACK